MLNSTIYLYNNKQCVVIDPSDPSTVKNTIKKSNWTPIAVVFTHSHFDHIVGIKPIIEKNSSIPIYINPNEAENLFIPKNNLSELVGIPFSIPKDANIIEVKDDNDFIVESSDSTFSVLLHSYFVPGHSIGSTMYEFKAKNEREKETTWLATGDFLFEGTVGRTDFAGGSPKDMKASLEKFKKRYAKRRDSDIFIIPGHAKSKNSPIVLLDEELETNPFLKRLL